MSIVGTSRLHGRDAEEYEGQKTDTARPSVRLDAQTEPDYRNGTVTVNMDYRVDSYSALLNDVRGDSYVVETLKQGKLTDKQMRRSIRKYGKEEASKWAAEEMSRREEAIEEAAQLRTRVNNFE